MNRNRRDEPPFVPRAKELTTSIRKTNRVNVTVGAEDERSGVSLRATGTNAVRPYGVEMDAQGGGSLIYGTGLDDHLDHKPLLGQKLLIN